MPEFSQNVSFSEYLAKILSHREINEYMNK